MGKPLQWILIEQLGNQEKRSSFVCYFVGGK